MTDHITSLPPEILSEIFTHCTTTHPDAPLTLSSTCRAFHLAALSSPLTWLRLRLSLSEDPHTDHRAAAKAAAWFARAGACPLSVSVSIPKASPILDESAALVHARRAQAPLLSSVLRGHRARIESLALHAYTERQAHSFLDSIYPNANTLTLRRLTLFVASDLLPIDEQQIPLFIPLLSSLTFLKLTSPGSPTLTAANLSNLQTLSIVRPIRAHPLPLESIVDVLHASHLLVHFELETRLDLPLEPSLPTPTPSPSFPTTPPALPLIPLPALTHLSLRTNNNPLLLTALLVPALHTLHLNALDGKRPGRAEQTARALRSMLARMDAPPRIHTLELAGVSIYRAPSPHGHPNASWEWCLRHMRALRRISARNMDPEHLVELLAQGMRSASVPGYRPLHSSPHPNTDSAPDNAVCPLLERLAVPAPEASAALRAFRLARPFVKVAALGFSRAAVYGGDSEDALKPRVISPPPALPYPSAQQPMGGSGGLGRTLQVEPKAKPKAKVDVDVSNTDTAPAPSPASPPIIVGGFGFGSSFSRMRPAHAQPARPLPDLAAVARRRDGVNW